MKNLYLIFFLSLLIQKSFAQSVDWVNYGGGVNEDAVTDVAVDPFGNVFVTGQMGNNADFNGTGVTGGIYVAKYDSSGVQQWVIAYGDTNSFGKGICLDSEGNIYAVGWMDSSMQVGDTLLTNLGWRDMIFMKFSPAGNLIWVKQFGGSKDDTAIKIVCDENDHIYLTGFFSSTAFIGNFLVNAASIYSDIFLARSDTAGNILWVKTAGGNGDDHGNFLALDGNGNIFTTGIFKETAYFGNSTVISNGLDDIFIAKYDTAGAFQWVRTAGASQSDSGLGICAAANGNCYVTGNFQNSVYFGNFLLTGTSGSHDFFVASYSPGGTCRWAKQATGTGTDRGSEIRMTDEGKVVIGGAFENAANFSGTTLSSGGAHDIFMARYDSLGLFETARKAGGSNDDRCFAIIPEKNNRIVAGGFFSGTATFGNYSLTSNGEEDAVIMRMNMGALYITSVSDSSLCPNQPIDVYFIAEGTFLPGNVFTIQLSNTTGEFTTYTTIGTLNAIYSGVVHATIPSSITPSNNYRIRISSTNSQCFGMFYTPLSVHANPSLVVTGTTSLCNGDSTELVVAGALMYNWIPSATLNTANNDSVIAFPTISTTYNITGTDQNGCIATVSKLLTVYNVIPFVGISASGVTTFCEGQTVLLSANNVAGTIYQWQLNGSNITGAVNYTYTANQTGNFTCIGTNPCGSSTSNAISILVNPKPIVTIGSFLPVCAGSPAFTLSSGLPLGGSYTGSYINNGIFTPSTVGTYTITYSYTDSNSCINSAATPMQILSNPTVSWGTVITSYCDTSSDVILTGGTPAGGVYSGTGVSNGIFDLSVAGPGTHTLTYKYTNVNGCYKTITKNFVVSAMPAISFTMDTVICINVSPFTLTGGTPTGGVYYVNGSLNTVFNPAALGTGYHEVVYRLVSGSCKAYDTVMVKVDVCVGINADTSSPMFVLSPNPSSGMVKVETNIGGEKTALKIFDALGKLRREFYFNAKEETSVLLDLRSLAPGIYSVQLSNDEARCTKLLVIE